MTKRTDLIDKLTFFYRLPICNPRTDEPSVISIKKLGGGGVTTIICVPVKRLSKCHYCKNKKIGIVIFC